MNWDDLRFVLTLAQTGSLARAARALGVDHTTVGRRVAAAEAALGVRLFTRTTTGVVPTADAEPLLASMRHVEGAVLALERTARSQDDRLEGTIRVTSPETFGVSWLAARLAAFGHEHPGLTVELVPAGQVFDLGRGEAEIAVRMFRSKQDDLVVRHAGTMSYGLYAAESYLERRPWQSGGRLADHAVLGCPGENDPETAWLRRLEPACRPRFVSTFSLALLAAARAGAGLAVLPRYLGDAEPALRLLPMPDPPADPIWLTVHQDLKDTPRVRRLLDFLVQALKQDEATLAPRSGVLRAGGGV